MDILNNLKVDGTITATGDITDGSSNKLSKKLDKLTTGPTAGTYTSVTVNGEGQVTGGSNPTTLSGYGITDAVNTTGDQTNIAGAKTWTGLHTFTAGLNTYGIQIGSDYTPMLSADIRFNSTRKIGSVNNANISNTYYYDGNNFNFAYKNFRAYSGYIRCRDYLTFPGQSSLYTELTALSDGTGYMLAPTRTYNASNVNDVVTIGSLTANPSVVHTTGNESIAGVKTFNNTIKQVQGNHENRIVSSEGTNQYNAILQTYAPNGTDVVSLILRIDTSANTGKLILGKYIGGSYTETQVGTI